MSTETTKKTEKKTGVQAASENEIVKIGQKPAINYILATVTLFSQGVKVVTLKARGKSISTAVSVEESVKRRMALEEPEVKLGTEEIFDDKIKRTFRVSTIDIILKR